MELKDNKSGRLDLNQRPPAPEAGALPGYATPRSTDSDGRDRRHSAPGETRTPNLLIRSQMLYPIELRAHERNSTLATNARERCRARAACAHPLTDRKNYPSG